MNEFRDIARLMGHDQRDGQKDVLGPLMGANFLDHGPQAIGAALDDSVRRSRATHPFQELSTGVDHESLPSGSPDAQVGR